MAVSPESILNHGQIGAERVCGDLDIFVYALREIISENGCSFEVTLAKYPRRNKFRVCINCNPEPHITSVWILASNFFRSVLFFAVNPRPHLVELQPFAA